MRRQGSAGYAAGMFALMITMKIRVFAQYAVVHYVTYVVRGLPYPYAQGVVNQSVGYIVLGLG
jgi:hypothetical protein